MKTLMDREPTLAKHLNMERMKSSFAFVHKVKVG
jgi:hypothetical protein